MWRWQSSIFLLAIVALLTTTGYRLAVASDSVLESVEVMLNRAGLHHYLDFPLSNEDVKPSKPHPDIYHKAIARMKLLPQECMVIEDNPLGIAAATAAGAHVLRVADPDEVRLSQILSFIKDSEKNRKFYKAHAGVTAS